LLVWGRFGSPVVAVVPWPEAKSAWEVRRERAKIRNFSFIVFSPLCGGNGQNCGLGKKNQLHQLYGKFSFIYWQRAKIFWLEAKSHIVNVIQKKYYSITKSRKNTTPFWT
tara:strand:- start:288 stop:617 length:330 start_codon:yes stop_codon:yes gene_type:complete